jgi:hypothetical protein
MRDGSRTGMKQRGCICLACKKPQQETRTLAWAELANAYRLGARACVIRWTPETFPFRS